MHRKTRHEREAEIRSHNFAKNPLIIKVIMIIITKLKMYKVVIETPNILNHNAFKYGAKGPFK